MDERFVSKTYRSIAITWAVALSWALALQKPWIGLSITFGMMFGTGILASFHWIVTRAFVPLAPKAKRSLVWLALVKYPLLLGSLWALTSWSKFDAAACCGGVALVHFAILAKYAGVRIVERRMARDIPPACPAIADKES